MKIINLRVMSPGGMAEFDIAINDAGEVFDPWKAGGQFMAGDEGEGTDERWHLTATTRDQLR